jgi:hypothetical protein
MSIFDSIKNAIFGKKAEAAPAPTSPRAAPASTAPAPTAPAAAAAAPVSEVDVAAVLEAQARKSGQPLNWRTSIVDLLKLLGIDSSLANRKKLAEELGFDGDDSDSATMNVWLHKRVMRKLAENGGKVPAELTD